MQANGGPTSQFVEIGLCELATSHQQSSLSGRLLGSISASNTPPPPPQQRPAPALGMASSAYASQLSTRATGASLHHALPLVPSTCHVQRVAVHLPLVEAKRCPASSVVCPACVTPSPRHCRGMHSLGWAPDALPVRSDAALPTPCQHHDATTAQPHVSRNSSRHWVEWLTIGNGH